MYLQDIRGIAAMEFAMILPLLSLLIFGGYATFQALNVDRALDRTSYITADLTSRLAKLDDNTVNNLLEVAKSLLGKAAIDNNYSITLSSISNIFDTNENYDLNIDWSFSNIPSKKLKIDDIGNYDIPFIPENESIILVNVEMEYSAMMFQNYIGVIALEQTATRKPRFVSQVVYE